MSGHSKWSTIKRKKGAVDAKRGKVFTRLIKELTIAARIGGGDISGNPRLRAAVAAAKAQNMPNDNIDRAIKKGTGELEGVSYEEITYEGYGPGGAAILITTLTDNRNRTTSDVRHILTRFGGNLGENGCVSWMFEKKAVLTYDPGRFSEDQLLEKGLDIGVEDVRSDEDIIEVIGAPGDLEAIKKGMEKSGMPPDSAEVTMIPQSTLKLTGKQAESMLKLMEALEDSDDVQNIYSNFDISAKEMEAAG